MPRPDTIGARNDTSAGLRGNLPPWRPPHLNLPPSRGKRFWNKEQRLEPLEIAHKVVEVAEEKQASDILLLDIRELSSFADFFVILTAESRRQMEALAQDMVQELKRSGSALHHREGGLDSGWLLLDFGDVIAHLFAPQEREYYRLEERWSRAKQIVTIQ